MTLTVRHREPVRSEIVRRPMGLFDRLQWPMELLNLNFDEDMRVDEHRSDGILVIRAQVPGVDPEKGFDLTVSDCNLNIRATRENTSEVTAKGYYCSELDYGVFDRSLPLPAGFDEKKISAECQNGVLDLHVPIGEQQTKHVAVTSR